MEVYLVGGAIRDELLGLPVADRDWVVTGATEADMLAEGYVRVGRDFPVFLHPQTHEEYALARVERKTAPGHKGFSATTRGVTLEQDLGRRDFTINAIARATDGTIIDPYGGCDDLAGHTLRHVGSAFSEDPLRVLRLARFAARLAPFNFQIAPETRLLARKMVDGGDLAELSVERIYTELYKAVAYDNPVPFFEVLDDIGALRGVFPGITPPVVRQFAEKMPQLDDADERLVYLFSLLSEADATKLTKLLRVPVNLSTLVTLIIRHYDTWANVLKLDANAQDALITGVDGYRRVERFQAFSHHCALRSAAGSGLAQHWLILQQLGLSVRVADLTTADGSGNSAILEGPQLGAALRAARIEKLKLLA